MLFVYSKKLCILICLILECTTEGKTKSIEKLPNQIMTISEGSDCKCRCILTTEEGKTCENNPKRKRIVFLVDSISKGKDCKCSCMAPTPPDNCKPPFPERQQQKETSREKTASTQRYEIKIPLSDDVKDGKIFMTIVGSSDEIQDLNALANRTDILQRTLTSFNSVKMQLKLATITLALEELKQEINKNFTENTGVLRHKILEVANALKEKNETRISSIDDDVLANATAELVEKRTDIEEDHINATSSNQRHQNKAESNSNINVNASNDDITIPNKVSSNRTVNFKSSNESVTQGTSTNNQKLDVISIASSLVHANLTSQRIRSMMTFSNNKVTPQSSTVDEINKRIPDRAKQQVIVESSKNGSVGIASEQVPTQTLNSKTQEENKASNTSKRAKEIKENLSNQVVVARIIEPSSNEAQIAKPSATEQTHQTAQANTTIEITASQTVSHLSPNIRRLAEVFTKAVIPTNGSVVLDQHKLNVSSKTSTASSTAQTTTSTISAMNHRSPPKISLGKVELYRSSKSKNTEATQKKSNTAKAYYEDYYDYSDTDDSLLVHPPLISSKVEPYGDEVDVTVTTTASTATTRAKKSDLDYDFEQTTPQYSVDDTTADDIVNFDTYSTDDYSDSYDDQHENSGGGTRLDPTTTELTTTPEKTPFTSPEACGTLLNLSQPRKVHDFGRKEGAWMMDSAADPENKNKIYIANFYYGNNLIEFESISRFKNFRWTNSYMLPYNWIGTGHIVYDGSFYYNRAFSRNLIKYNLKYRFVSAWGHLRNAVYDSSTPFTWRGHTMVHMAADNTGLWVIYPAYSDFQLYPNSDSYVINKINPHDLSTISSWRTSLRRNTVSHFFVVCGVVYATDRYNTPKARITFAYDTHTRVRRALYLPFSNRYSHNVQLLYDFNERKLLSWDNGHQVTYDVNLTY